MALAHCAKCAVYEQRVMAKAPGEALPPEVIPCGDFVMSDAFRDWAVAEMRKEVLGQVSGAGLDRMALIKTKPEDSDQRRGAADRGGQNHHSKSK